MYNLGKELLVVDTLLRLSFGVPENKIHKYIKNIIIFLDKICEETKKYLITTKLAELSLWKDGLHLILDFYFLFRNLYKNLILIKDPFNYIEKI